MKHNIKITIILLAMFLVTQLISLAVIYSYSPKNQLVLNQTTGIYENQTITSDLPFGFQPPEMSSYDALTSMIIAIIIAVVLLLLLMKIKAAIFLKFWFFFVVVIALGITINSVVMKFNISPYWVLLLALPLAYLKIFKRNMVVHNVTELFIYPGIAAVFVPILNIPTVIILLIAISVYDIYAVWHAKFMQKMAKYQINELKVFSGFFIPYLGNKERKQVELLRQKYKNHIPDKIVKKKKIKVNLAILGGGDVVFPAILAGVVLVSRGLIPALIVSLFATIALLLLFIAAKKGKFYPAMPFLTAGCLAGLLVAWFI